MITRLLVPALTIAMAASCGISAESTAVEVTVEIPRLEPLEGEAEELDAVAIPVYLVEGDRFVRVLREQPPEVVDNPQAVLEELIRGATGAEARAGIRSAIPNTTRVIGLDVLDGLATVDLSAEFSVVGGDEELLAVGQVALTLTSTMTVDRVAFSLAGTPIGVPRPDGALTREPVTFDDYEALVVR